MTTTQQLHKYFVSLELDDPGGSPLAGDINSAVFSRAAVCIISAHLFNKISPELKNGDLIDGNRWSIFHNNARDIVVLIPEAYRKNILADHALSEELVRWNGGKPPRRTLKSGEVATAGTGPVVDDSFLEKFRQIFGKSDARKAFFMIGHGGGGTQPFIVSIHKSFWEKFFITLHEIGGVTCLYLNSCTCGAANIVGIQNMLAKLANKDAAFVYYPIIIQATSDTPTASPLVEHLSEFFRALEAWLAKPNKPAGLEIALRSLYPNGTRIDELPSVRLPGKISFFRAVDMGDTIALTFAKMRKTALKNMFQKLPNRLVVPAFVRFIQVYPANVMDLAIKISVSDLNVLPQFISKNPGNGVHMMGTIESGNAKVLDIMTRCFFKESGKIHNRAWFIRRLIGSDGALEHVVVFKYKEMPKDGARLQRLILMYHDPAKGEYVRIQSQWPFQEDASDIVRETMSREEFWSKEHDIFIQTQPLPEVLEQASGGNETVQSLGLSFEEWKA